MRIIIGQMSHCLVMVKCTHWIVIVWNPISFDSNYVMIIAIISHMSNSLTFDVYTTQDWSRRQWLLIDRKREDIIIMSTIERLGKD